MTIKLLNNTRGLFGPESGKIPVSVPTNNIQNPEKTKLTTVQKNNVKDKLAKRRE